MKSKGTRSRKRYEGREYLQICPTFRIRRLTEREVEQFRKGIQAVIDRTVRA